MNEEPEDRAGCKCYPVDRYPAFLRKGCDHFDKCHVLAETRALSTPEGREAARAAYHAEAKIIADQKDKRLRIVDVLQKLQRLGIPASTLYTLRESKETVALKHAKAWWPMSRQTFPALVMLGDSGQGKTVAAAWCAAEWARDYPWNALPTGSLERPLVWLDGPRLRELSSFDESAAQLLNDAARAHLTILDDAGRDGSPKAMEVLSDVLMERVDNFRATILTSNLKGQEFRARYGPALADRLRSCAVIPPLKGASLRPDNRDLFPDPKSKT